MRGSIGRSNSIISNVTKQTPFLFQSSSPFCSGSGRGRGRGRGVTSGPSQFAPTKPPGQPVTESKTPGQPASESKPDSPPTGLGHGRGRPAVNPSQVLPAFSSFISSVKSGTGRGSVISSIILESDSSQSTDSPRQESLRSRTFSPTESSTDTNQPSQPNHPSSVLSASILSALPGAGRGKPGVGLPPPPTPTGTAPQVKEENRHIRAPRQRPEAAPAEAMPPRPKLSKEDAVKHTLRILSQGGAGGGPDPGGMEESSSGRGRMGMGGRGLGRGRGRGRGRGFRRDMEDEDEGAASGLYLGDNADGEKFAEKIGVENMNMLVEGFEELSGSVLPSPMEDAYIDALHTNYMIECEPEYLMEEFGTNPDIDEKPPIPLRDALEKMKPFLMAYEGIQSQEEWEEAINEVMERVPLLKEIVDHYSGPDRVTAKTQQEELERVAKTIPESAPASVKGFANRAVLSLQSNPGWGFDKKCQFMDKLVREVSQPNK